ncbi:phosphopantothenoylcysteine decarboxylase-like isoform X1 [Varroa jacobsoni]|uniref:phosphopantothenoylcysteine decarboxylase-like isoform X1 n=1 Tax=Varroa jacobsoni TaxID=62625 RepID=UPI000BF24F9F|nr:phosphopantothenoylcysteine decarboxylase-like isoform X1 [Varroa jacobsoni]
MINIEIGHEKWTLGSSRNLVHTEIGKRPRQFEGNGSVASLKAPDLIQKLKKLDIPGHEIKVQVVTTERAKHFYSQLEAEIVHDDVAEWSSWNKRSDPVLHIELRKWADIFVIAPLDANTMAKMCTGICDNLFTCVVRAWDLNRPLLFAPAMNTFMYEHPLTRKQIGKLTAFGYIEIPAISKKLVCGDTGLGAMANVDTIVEVTRNQANGRVVGRTWRKL